jgi:hypothetical protein
LSLTFSIQNVLNNGDVLSPLLFNFALNTPLGRSRKPRGTEIRWDISAAGLCDDANLLADTVKRKTETSIDANEEADLDENAAIAK